MSGIADLTPEAKVHPLPLNGRPTLHYICFDIYEPACYTSAMPLIGVNIYELTPRSSQLDK